MRLIESLLKCYECRKTSTSEEVEVVTHGGKAYWICPHCDFETIIVYKVSPCYGEE
jgi:hypothetical protein